MMKQAQRKLVYILIAVVFLCTAALSEVIRPGHDQYMLAARAIRPGDVREEEAAKSVLRDTSFQALLPTLLGVREVMASLMWVRADDYFHRGEYRPIISMIKQIVAIDPHQIDVYATGAWHMAYNFMDKRLIQDGVQFLQEGTKNNDAVYDLYFELGYMHYDKTKDYRQAVAAYETASTRGTTTGKKIPPSYVRHQLGHAIEKMGDIDQAIERWEKNVEIAEGLKEEQQAGGVAGPNTAAAIHNLYITARRKNERLAAVAERARDAATALRYWQANVDLANARLVKSGERTDIRGDLRNAQNNVDRLRAGKLNPAEPTNVDIRFTVTRVAPKQLLVEGTANVLNLSRVRVQFSDKDYEERIKKGFDFKMNECSLEWENVSVNNQKFKHTVNLDRDPADMGRAPTDIYPLKAEEYTLSVSYNPRLQAAFIQDRYGWNGEGLTAPEGQLVIDESKAGILDGKRYPLRTVQRTVTLKREDLLGKERKVLYTTGS